MEQKINGSVVIPQHPSIPFLEGLLQAARQGRIEAMFVVTVSPLGEIQTPAVGTRAAELYVGLDMAKAKIMAALTQPGPQLVRPRP